MQYSFGTVYERDMDFLLIQAFATDKGFLELFLAKVGINSDEVIVDKTIKSNVELDLGESDITVVLRGDEKTYGLLIEDKIDAVDMDEQHERYIKRGKVAVERGDYDEFFVFIVCPRKYLDTNDEAKLYENHVLYEEMSEYFAKKDDEISKFRAAQIS